MTTSTPTPRPRRWLVSAIAVPLLAIAALSSWAFASPIGAGADDDFHLSSIWCGGLEAENLCEPAAAADEREVSRDLFRNAHCYFGQPAVSASCQGEYLGDDLTEDVQATDRGNFAGLYPPVYYFAMSAFAGDNLQISALTMRVATSVLFVGMVTAIFFLLPVRRRLTLVLSIIATIVPLGMFYIPSNNPSSWALISAGTLWMALLGYFEATGKRRVLLGAIAVVATVMGAGARADAAIYSGVAVVAVVALTATRTRAYLLSLILPAALGVLALIALVSAGQTGAASTGLSDTSGREQHPVVGLIANNILQLPHLLAGSFGSWPLGWLDTTLPAIVAFGASLAFIVAVTVGLRSPNRRKTWVSIGVLGLFLLVPSYILLRSNAFVGTEVQPRYILPLLILLTGIVLLQSPQRELRLSQAQALVIVVALAAANSVALHTNIRRYVTGLDAQSGNLDNAAEWWWTIPISPMTMWFIGSASFGLMLLALARVWLKTQRPEPIDRAITSKWEPISV